MITAAACVIDGQIMSLPPPARHHTILHKYPLTDGHDHGEQGFIDDQEGFVNRRRAAQIALEQGQIEKLISPPKLYSEDLW